MSSFSLDSLGPVPHIFDPRVDTGLGMDAAGNIQLSGLDYDHAQKTLGPIARYGDPSARLILDLLEVEVFGDLPKTPRNDHHFDSPVKASEKPDPPRETRRMINELSERARKRESENRPISEAGYLALLDSSIFKIDRILRESGIEHTDFSSESTITEAIKRTQAKGARRNKTS